MKQRATRSGSPRVSIRQRVARLLNFDLFGADVENVSTIPSRPAPEAVIEQTRTAGDYRTFNAASVGLTVAEIPTALPPVSELYRQFDLYNLLHFDGRLPRVRIVYSTRMLAAGSCSPSVKEIRIGVQYHQIFPGDIPDTLKHEMIHLIHFYHDEKFIAKARELGVSIKAKSHPRLRRTPRYLYACPSCEREYPRQRRLRMASCGYCTPGKTYNERYKLRLVTAQKR